MTSYEEPFDVRSLFRTARQVAEEAYENILRYQNREYEPAKTCYSYLNEAMLGGLYPQNVMAIGARPGVGKSYVTQKIIESVMDVTENPQAGSYLLVNCEFEMTGLDLLTRKISREIKKPVKNILLEKPVSEEDKRIREIVESEKKENVIYIPRPITVEELNMAIDHIMRRNAHRRLVIWKIDHIMLIKRNGGDPKKTMDSAIAVINDAKLKYGNLSFIIDSQFNRDIEGRRMPKEHEPRLSDFYMSDELGQLCSTMIGLNNPRRMGYDSYMTFPESWYKSLDAFKTQNKKSFRTEGLLFHHVLKVRQMRLEDLPYSVYPEVMPGYEHRYATGEVRTVKPEAVNPEKPPYKIGDSWDDIPEYGEEDMPF